MSQKGAVQELAPAKINLTLHVTGQRPDGYHLLDSLVVFADFGDLLTIAPAEAPSLTLTGPLSAGLPTDDSNLVRKAMAFAGWTGAVTLEKRLPAAAGIGGGSVAGAGAFAGRPPARRDRSPGRRRARLPGRPRRKDAGHR